jgi:acyl-CoA synthetase (AMP-forming)/AMP-acid ligase II
VPSVFRHFVETLTGEEAFPALRLIRVSGEPVSRSDVESYRRHFSAGCLFVNQLGATEVPRVRQYFIDQATPIPSSVLPVGYALEDVEVLLWDETGGEVEGDSIGEIVVRGHYVSPGYWRQPELTDTVFLPDPADGHRRLYRTGDLGRLWPDGCLEYLGRKDTQTKVSGQRVEVALARIWAEVLGLAQVGIHDPFLELGGHSLLAMQIVSRVLSTLRVAIDVTTLLETPTVAQMAVVITQHLARHVLPEDLDGLLAEVEMLSEAEVSRRLSNAGSSEAGEDGPSRAPSGRKPISESEPYP